MSSINRGHTTTEVGRTGLEPAANGVVRAEPHRGVLLSAVVLVREPHTQRAATVDSAHTRQHCSDRTSARYGSSCLPRTGSSRHRDHRVGRHRRCTSAPSMALPAHQLERRRRCRCIRTFGLMQATAPGRLPVTSWTRRSHLLWTYCGRKLQKYLLTRRLSSCRGIRTGHGVAA